MMLCFQHSLLFFFYGRVVCFFLRILFSVLGRTRVLQIAVFQFCFFFNLKKFFFLLFCHDANTLEFRYVIYDQLLHSLSNYFYAIDRPVVFFFANCRNNSVFFCAECCNIAALLRRVDFFNVVSLFSSLFITIVTIGLLLFFYLKIFSKMSLCTRFRDGIFFYY